jgi:hypothetical protein
VLAARQVGSGKQIKEVNGTAKMRLNATWKREWRPEIKPLVQPVYNLAER